MSIVNPKYCFPVNKKLWMTHSLCGTERTVGSGDVELFTSHADFAEYVVKACNHHDDLVQALAAMLADAKRRKYKLAENIEIFARETLSKAR